MELKFTSLNLAGYKDWSTREASIIQFINRTQPDVLLLQEVKFDPAFSYYNQAVNMNQQLESPFHYHQSTISKYYQPSSGEAFREGLVALSKFPIINSEALVLVKQADDKHPRIIQNVNLNLGNEELHVTNVHFSNNHHSVGQLQELLTILRERQDQRIIVGDFNIFSLQEHGDLYSDTYSSSTDFKPYISFPAEDRTLDYALVPKDLALISIETTPGLSDHAAVTFTIHLNS